MEQGPMSRERTDAGIWSCGEPPTGGEKPGEEGIEPPLLPTGQASFPQRFYHVLWPVWPVQPGLMGAKFWNNKSGPLWEGTPLCHTDSQAFKRSSATFWEPSWW